MQSFDVDGDSVMNFVGYEYQKPRKRVVESPVMEDEGVGSESGSES